MKHVLTASLILCSTSAIADCYFRINSTIPQSLINSQPTDVQRMVVPDNRGQKCTLQYRLHVENNWQTVEGIGYGKTDTEACAQALDTKRGAILREADAGTVRADSQMVCSDLPDIRVRKVLVGERIWESETEMHNVDKTYFNYKQTTCRFFTERGSRGGNFYPYQGVICRENMTGNSKWVVVDKF